MSACTTHASMHSEQKNAYRSGQKALLDFVNVLHGERLATKQGLTG